MNPVKRLREKVGYVQSVNRCGTCEHIDPPRIVMTWNSRTIQQPPMCKKHMFNVQLRGICKDWEKQTPKETT